jgi:hypothetical protein
LPQLAKELSSTATAKPVRESLIGRSKGKDLSPDVERFLLRGAFRSATFYRRCCTAPIPGIPARKSD